VRILSSTICAGLLLFVLPLAHAQSMPPAQPVPELGYKVAPDFFQFPPTWVEGEASGVALNSKGHVFLFQRTRPMLSEFDEKGHFIRSIGEGLFDHPHGLRIDDNDDLWTTDDTNNTVLKISPAGKVLLVLGHRSSLGGDADWLFNKPTDVAFSKNGDIFVADGYGNSRVVKFDRNGNYLKSWGSYGSGPGEFMLPHTIVVDKNDRVYVGDRENARIQIFDTEGRFLKQWTGIGYPYGLFVTPDQHIWMIDGGFDRVVEFDQTGKVLGAIGSPGHQPGQFAWGHFLAIAPDRTLIVADVLNWRFQVFAPTKASGKLSDYVPKERKFFGFKPSDGYVFRSPGWPTK
jgi:DNA-binding beta-propeller fold protein YncE